MVCWGMNILLVTEQEQLDSGDYKITGKKFTHLKNILKVKKDDQVIMGEVNGLMGYGKVLEVNGDYVLLKPVLTKNPPQKLPIKVILALPRPKMLKRILRDLAMMGVGEIYLINTYKVEKSFWQTDLLLDHKYHHYFLEGLSQSRDTILPKFYIKKRFKPFIEDELIKIAKGTRPIVAHLGDYPTFPRGEISPMTLAIGPEGGFTEYEIKKFQEAGFMIRKCGERVLRMEVAVPVLLSQHGAFY